MGAQEPTPEELQEQLEQEQQRTAAQVDAAGDAARREAEAAGVTEEEVKKRIQQARTEEKDKLYPQLEALKGALEEIRETLREERAEKEEIKKKAKEETERARLETMSDTDRILESHKNLEEQLREEREARIKSEKDARERERLAHLREYRREALQAAEDAGEAILLPELVQGNTEAEIDAAIIIAKARSAELAEQFKTELGTKTRRNMPRPTSPSMEALEEEELSEQLNQVDPVKYRNDKAYREQIQNELASAYAQSMR